MLSANAPVHRDGAIRLAKQLHRHVYYEKPVRLRHGRATVSVGPGNALGARESDLVVPLF